jgi:hypothetical protein
MPLLAPKIGMKLCRFRQVCALPIEFGNRLH